MKIQPNPEQQQLLHDIHHAAGSLSQAWRLFDQACDPDEIEASIYTIHAQAARYTQLLKQAKEAQLHCPYPGFRPDAENSSHGKR